MAKEAVMGAVVNVGTQERVAFIRRTYAHLMGAIVAFIVLEFFLLRADFARPLVLKMISGYNWAGVLVAFMAVGWIADWWAQKTESKALQYLGLGIYVVAEAFIFLPIIYIANRIDPQIVPTAGIITLLAFAGLTLTVFVTGKDFSFLRGFLFLLTFVGIGILVAGLAFGFPLGMWFSALFVAIASGYVLYYTSNILYHYRTDQHVSAALGLFAAIALLFWYILRIGIALASSDQMTSAEVLNRFSTRPRGSEGGSKTGSLALPCHHLTVNTGSRLAPRASSAVFSWAPRVRRPIHTESDTVSQLLLLLLLNHEVLLRHREALLA